MDEKIIDHCTGFAVEHLRMRTPHALPSLDRLAQNGVHRLGESGRRLVDRDVEQTDRGCPSLCSIVSLPTDAADWQAMDLVAPQTAKQPEMRERADHFDWIIG